MPDITLLKASAYSALQTWAQGQIDAAFNTATNNFSDGRVWHTSNANLATQTPPASTDQISVATNVGHITWRRLNVAPDPVDPETHAQTADGIWWYLSEDTSAIKTRLGQAELAVMTLNVASPSAQTIPASRVVVATHINGVQIWEVVPAPGDGLELDDLKRSADNRWWLRVMDTRQSEFRAPRLFSSRADALALLASNPPPAQVHRVFSVEGDRLNIRSRVEPNFDPLFAQAPFWGIESSLLMAGSPSRPLIIGAPETGTKLRADYGAATGMETDWQISDTGVGTAGWSVIGSGDTITPNDLRLGKYLRFRTRGASTGMGWAVSNVIGPIVTGQQTGTPLDIVSSVNGYGASRRRRPRHHASLAELHDLRDGAGAAPPLDLYRDHSLSVGTQWLGAVSAPLPVTACNLQTIYSPAENVIHPCVVEFFNDFCGYRYVCAITAYPTGPSLEDPFVYGSNDRMNWTFLGGAPQPLNAKSATTGSYNSDTFLTHDPRTGELIVGWRRYEPRDNTSSAEANSDVVLMCRTSRNGYAWSPVREIMRIPADQQIMLAPTVIFDPETGTWHMWVINRPVMHHWTAPSLYGPWTLDAATTDLSSFDTPHHHEVKWVGDKLACLLYARGAGQLYFGTFENGSWTQVNWNMAGVLNPRPTSVYKASFVPVIDPAAGTVAIDLWWTEGAAGPAGGTNMGHGRKLQYSRTNAATAAIIADDGSESLDVAIQAGLAAALPGGALERGDVAELARMNGNNVIAILPSGHVELRLSDDAVADVRARLDLDQLVALSAPLAADLAGDYDAWDVWQRGDLTYFTGNLWGDRPRGYVRRGAGLPWAVAPSVMPLRLVTGDHVANALPSAAPNRWAHIATLGDGADQDGLNGAVPAGPAADLARAGAGFAALSADRGLAARTGALARYGVRSEAVEGATLAQLAAGQPLANLVRARTEFARLAGLYGGQAATESVTVLHSGGAASITAYRDALVALAGTLVEQLGAGQVNVIPPGGTWASGTDPAILGAVEALRTRGAVPLVLASPIHWCGILTGSLATPDAPSMTMLAELDALATAAGAGWHGPVPYQAVRSGNTILVDCEVMPGADLVAPTYGVRYSGAAITAMAVVAEPLTGRMTRLQITLASAAAGTLSIAHGATGTDQARFANRCDMRDSWGATSVTGQTLRRYTHSARFEVT